jgi:hypothetical protein
MDSDLVVAKDHGVSSVFKIPLELKDGWIFFSQEQKAKRGQKCKHFRCLLVTIL